MSKLIINEAKTCLIINWILFIVFNKEYLRPLYLFVHLFLSCPHFEVWRLGLLFCRLSDSPATNFCLVDTLSEWLILVDIGPVGTKAVGKCQNVRAPMSRPGAVLSHTPSKSVPS